MTEAAWEGTVYVTTETRRNADAVGDVARPRDQELVETMLDLFSLEQTGDGRFAAPARDTPPRPVFGGQIVAQALRAASATVPPDRRVHSLHAYYVRAGSTDLATRFEVSADSDGRMASFRRVQAFQDERLLLNCGMAFQAPVKGFSHQIQACQAPPPEELQDDYLAVQALREAGAAAHSMVGRASPFRFRSLNLEARFTQAAADARQAFWFRLARPIPEADPTVRRVVLAYASDMMLLGVGLMPHGHRWFDGETRIASLDHALWIHADVDWDDWLLYAQEGVWSGNGRALNRGQIFDRRGRLVATVTQEGLMLPKA